jgi:hypothetical protein
MWHKLAQVMPIVFPANPITGNKPQATAGTTLKLANSLYE